MVNSFCQKILTRLKRELKVFYMMLQFFRCASISCHSYNASNSCNASNASNASKSNAFVSQLSGWYVKSDKWWVAPSLQCQCIGHQKLLILIRCNPSLISLNLKRDTGSHLFYPVIMCCTWLWCTGHIASIWQEVTIEHRQREKVSHRTFSEDRTLTNKKCYWFRSMGSVGFEDFGNLVLLPASDSGLEKSFEVELSLWSRPVIDSNLFRNLCK